MISVVYSRPTGWAEAGSSVLDLHHAPLGGLDPRRNSGKPAGDGIGVAALPEWVDKLVQMLRDVKPALFVRDVVQRFDAGMMQRCRDASPDTVWCLVEGNQPDGVSKFVARLKQFVDVVMINSDESETINKYLNFGVSVVPCFWDGHHPEDHEQHPAAWATRDCFFGGSNRRVGAGWEFPAGRERYEFIRAVWSQFDLEMHGHKKEWGPHAGGMLSHHPYNQAMQNARVVLGYPTFELRRYYTRRTIHSLACGRPFVTRWIPGIEEDFKQGEGIFWFKKNVEGVEYIKHLLSDDRERSRMANAAKLNGQAHTWEARLRRLEKIAPQLVDANRREPFCVR